MKCQCSAIVGKGQGRTTPRLKKENALVGPGIPQPGDTIILGFQDRSVSLRAHSQLPLRVHAHSGTGSDMIRSLADETFNSNQESSYLETHGKRRQYFLGLQGTATILAPANSTSLDCQSWEKMLFTEMELLQRRTDPHIGVCECILSCGNGSFASKEKGIQGAIG